MTIDYDHSANPHSVEGPRAAWSKLFPDEMPASILDVGCGTGTWLQAASERGVTDVVGVDGVDIPRENLLFPPDKFIHVDLSKPLALGRRFSLAICLEVGEHLEANASRTLVGSLTKHANTVLFSAACPGQDGQHHVNCQWANYWQALFNLERFLCDDSPRWIIWDDSRIEPWYRQNIFIARSNDTAGKELRIKSVVHPEVHRVMGSLPEADEFMSHVSRIENGGMPTGWYFKTPVRAMVRKLRRRLR